MGGLGSPEPRGKSRYTCNQSIVPKQDSEVIYFPNEKRWLNVYGCTCLSLYASVSRLGILGTLFCSRIQGRVKHLETNMYFGSFAAALPL